MWTDNTRNARLRGDQIEVFNILNGYVHIDSNIFFLEITESKITRGHNYASYMFVTRGLPTCTILIRNKLYSFMMCIAKSGRNDITKHFE